VCARWIAEERDVAHVLPHLGEAHFDPELFARHEGAISAAFAREARA
jgi:hypothetical protein